MVWTNTKDKALKDRARKVIPRGMYGHESTVLLPKEFPQFFARGKGCRIWDVDGNEYVDIMCAFGPNLLGYCDLEIGAAAAEAAGARRCAQWPRRKSWSISPKQFVGMVTHASWAMFCKNGTDATTMAMVVARAQTGAAHASWRPKAPYHGAAPWCVPAARSTGTLPEDRAHIVYYNYNDTQSLDRLPRSTRTTSPAVFATPFVHEVFVDEADPDPSSQHARGVCATRHGALLVVDDVRAGFRVARDCSWSQIRCAARPVDLGQVLRQRLSDLGAARFRTRPRKGAAKKST